MFSLFVAVACLTSLTQASPQTNGASKSVGRIIGGESTFIEKIPYQASLRFVSRHTCGAVIISENYLLTAAHCTDGIIAQQLAIRAGSSYHNSSGVIIPVAAVYQHPYYDFKLNDYDVSILRLESPLSFGPTIAPVTLPDLNQPVIAGSIAQISGWGIMSEHTSIGNLPEQLQVVQVPIVGVEECTAAYADEDRGITDRMICTGRPEGGKDACRGDSGGPVTVNGTLVGLVSFSEGCARPDYPGVHTRVPVVRSYITFVTGL